MMMQNYNADSYLQYLLQKKVNYFYEPVGNMLIMFYLSVKLFLKSIAILYLLFKTGHRLSISIARGTGF